MRTCLLSMLYLMFMRNQPAKASGTYSASNVSPREAAPPLSSRLTTRASRLGRRLQMTQLLRVVPRQPAWPQLGGVRRSQADGQRGEPQRRCAAHGPRAPRLAGAPSFATCVPAFGGYRATHVLLFLWGGRVRSLLGPGPGEAAGPPVAMEPTQAQRLVGASCSAFPFRARKPKSETQKADEKRAFDFVEFLGRKPKGCFSALCFRAPFLAFTYIESQKRSTKTKTKADFASPETPPTHNPRPTAHMQHSPQFRPPSGPRARSG